MVIWPEASSAQSSIGTVSARSLMARDFDARVAELHVRAALPSGFAALGMPVTEPVA